MPSVNDATATQSHKDRLDHLRGEIVIPASVNDAENAQDAVCGNPLCRVPVRTHPKAIYLRLYCSDRCRLDAWTLRKAASLLAPLGESKAWEILAELVR